MILANHQPNFMPNLAFFSKVKAVDTFVITTNIQFEKRGFQKRNKINNNGHDQWLTVPVTGSSLDMIKDIQVAPDGKWIGEHIKILRSAYQKEKYSNHIKEIIDIYEGNEWKRLADLNIALIHYFTDILGLSRTVVDEETTGYKETFLVNVLDKHSGKELLSGQGGKNYLTPERVEFIEKNGYKLSFHEHSVPAAEYPYAALHYLFTEGPEWIKEKI